MSILVNFQQNTKVIALLFGQKSLILITFQSAIKINQFQFWSFVAKIPRLQPYSLSKHRSFPSLSISNQHQSISILVICRQNTKVIALLFGHKSLIFITFTLQSTSINFNFCHLSANYQGYSLTFRPIIAHFHHLSICNQNQSMSMLVISRQNTKVIALLFGQKSLISITFHFAININQFQFW